MSDAKPVSKIVTPVDLPYVFTPGVAGSRFLKAIADKKLLGQACNRCGKVYIPPRGSCPRCGVPTDRDVEVADKGTVVSFSIVRVPSEGIAIDLPFACLSILLDGSDIPFFHVAGEVDVETVRMGMRVQAVWVPDEELRSSLESIRYFKPIDEPDVAFAEIEEHL